MAWGQWFLKKKKKSVWFLLLWTNCIFPIAWDKKSALKQCTCISVCMHVWAGVRWAHSIVINKRKAAVFLHCARNQGLFPQRSTCPILFMISNGTIPNDGCSTDGPSSLKGTVPWVQLFGSTSHLFLAIWCPAYVLLSVDKLEEHLALGWGSFFFFLLLSWFLEEIQNTCTNLEDASEAQGKVIFHAKHFLAMKGFKTTAFQGFPVLKISIPDPWISSPIPMAALGLWILLTGQFHKISFPPAKSA